MALLAAFSRQRQGVACKFCGVVVATQSVRRHQDQCGGSKAEDGECEVLCEKINPNITVTSTSSTDPSLKAGTVKKRGKRSLDALESGNNKPAAQKARKSDGSVQSSAAGHLEPAAAVQPATLMDDVTIDSYHIRVFNQICVLGHKRAPSDIWATQQTQLWTAWNHTLSDVSRQLFIRLFLRKSGKWHTKEQVTIEHVQNTEQALAQLTQHAFLHSSGSAENGLHKLTEVLCLLSLPQLRELAKSYKVPSSAGHTKPQLTAALKLHAKQKNVFGCTIESNVVKKALSVLGPCYQVNNQAERFFLCLFNLCAPQEMNSVQYMDSPLNTNLKSQLMNALRQVETGEAKYAVSITDADQSTQATHHVLFLTHRHWNDQLDAQECERAMAYCQWRQQWLDVMALGAQAHLELLARQSQVHALLQPVPVCMHQFTALWIWTRCVWHAVEAAQRLKQYNKAVEYLEFLLTWSGSDVLCADYRGRWHERLALNQHIHLKEPHNALYTINRAFNDQFVRAPSQLCLFERYEKLCKKQRKSDIENEEEQIGASELDVCQQLRQYKTPDTAPIYEFSAATIGKDLGEGERKNVFVQMGADQTATPSSVEMVALNHYIQHQNFKHGYHGEGAPWHALLALCFWDAVHDTDTETTRAQWWSPVQTRPLDIYHSCPPAFVHSLKWSAAVDTLRTAQTQDLRRVVLDAWQTHLDCNTDFVSWDTFRSDPNILADLAVCVGGVRLAQLFEYMVADMRFRRSGFPDLVVFNAELCTVKVIEVKGPGDRLSTKQRVWLHYFNTQLHIPAECCLVKGTHPKLLAVDSAPSTE